MRRVVVSEFVSLDGVMEEPSWTFGFEGEDRDRYKFAELAESGALLLGRITYEGFAAVWPGMEEETGEYGVWMNSYPKYVVSTTLEEPLAWNGHRIPPADLAERVAALKEEPGRDILVFGSGELVNALLERGLADEYRLMVFPVVVGRGKRLFEGVTDARNLRLVGTRTFESGVVVLTYEPARDE